MASATRIPAVICYLRPDGKKDDNDKEKKLPEKDVPAAIKTAFHKSHPTVKNVKWEKEKGNYEAEFEMNKMEQSVLLDASGNTLETEMEIPVNQLPATVKDYISKNYPGAKIKEASKITDNKGTITYEAEVHDKDLIFDSKSNFLTIEKE